MGWKGTVRSLATASRRIERGMAREQQRIAAMETVHTYEGYIEAITSLHKECGVYPNWKTMAEQYPPVEPKQKNPKENKALDALHNYKPNFLERTFSFLKGWHVKSLNKNIYKARARDAHEYERASAEFKNAYKKWEEETTLARKIIKGEGQGYIDAIKKFEPFSDIGEIGTELQLGVDK